MFWHSNKILCDYIVLSYFHRIVYVCCVFVSSVRIKQWVLSLPPTEWTTRSIWIHTFVWGERVWVQQHHGWCIKTLLPCSTLFFLWWCSMGERLVALCLLTFYSPYSQYAQNWQVHNNDNFIVININQHYVTLIELILALARCVCKSVSCCRYLDGPGHQFVIINIYNFGFCCRWIWERFWIWMLVAQFVALSAHSFSRLSYWSGEIALSVFLCLCFVIYFPSNSFHSGKKHFFFFTESRFDRDWKLHSKSNVNWTISMLFLNHQKVCSPIPTICDWFFSVIWFSPFFLFFLDIIIR